MQSTHRKPAYGEGKQALIEAAIRLIAREGLGRLTYRSLTAEACVTAGALQHHFKSMDKVLEEALEYCVTKSIDSSQHVQTASEFIEVIVHFMHEYPDMQNFQVEVFAAARYRPCLRLIVAKHQELYRKLVKSMLLNMNTLHDDDLVEFITASVDGIVFQAHMLGNVQQSRTDRQFDTLKRIIANYSIIPGD